MMAAAGADKIPGPFNTVVFLGHSFTANNDLVKRVNVLQNASCALYNRGINGDKYTDMLARFDTDVSPNNPDLVLLDSPTNDITNGITAATIQATFNSIKAKCDLIGATLMTTELTPWKNYSMWTEAKQTQTELWNAILPSIGVAYTKSYDILGEPGSPEELNALYDGLDGVPDGLHLNSAGFDIYAPIRSSAFTGGINGPAEALKALGWAAGDDFDGLAPHPSFGGGKVKNHVMDLDETFLGWFDVSGVGNWTTMGDGSIGNTTQIFEKIAYDTGNQDGIHNIDLVWPSNPNMAVGVRDTLNGNDAVYVLISSTTISLYNSTTAGGQVQVDQVTGLSYTPGDIVKLEAVCNGTTISFTINDDSNTTVSFNGFDINNTDGKITLFNGNANHRFRKFRTKLL